MYFSMLLPSLNYVQPFYYVYDFLSKSFRFNTRLVHVTALVIVPNPMHLHGAYHTYSTCYYICSVH